MHQPDALKAMEQKEAFLKNKIKQISRCNDLKIQTNRWDKHLNFANYKMSILFDYHRSLKILT